VPAKATYAHPTVLLHRREAFLQSSGGWRADIPWLFSLWPVAPEALFVHGARLLAEHQEGVYIDSERRRYLEPLLDADVPLGPYATLLLAFGLAAKDGSVHGLATDALIAAAEDGRLDPERLGGAIAEIAAIGAGKFARWAKTLAEAARVSLLHAEAVRQTVQRVLQGEPPAAVREIGPLVELFVELCVRCGRGVTAAATRTFLAQLSGGGKIVQGARRLLALTPAGEPAQARAVQALVLEQRLIRAERWQGRQAQLD
jgi:hypothetical protein